MATYQRKKETVNATQFTGQADVQPLIDNGKIVLFQDVADPTKFMVKVVAKNLYLELKVNDYVEVKNGVPSVRGKTSFEAEWEAMP